MGLIHVYCGDGKGKSTSAIGLAVRFAGSGKKVIILQFLKGSETCELYSLSKIDSIKVFRNTQDLGFTFNMSADDKLKCYEYHTNNLKKALEAVKLGKCDLLVLDELTYAYSLNLVDKGLVESLILNKPAELELVITGQNPDSIFTDNADYISEIRAVKHPFEKGIPARRGIEY